LFAISPWRWIKVTELTAQYEVDFEPSWPIYELNLIRVSPPRQIKVIENLSTIVNDKSVSTESAPTSIRPFTLLELHDHPTNSLNLQRHISIHREIE
jgi:hypothetical protein